VQPAAAADKLVVVMDFLPSWKHAAFHLAKVKGWYQQAGLEVQVDDGSGSANTIAQTATEKCDLGLASLSAMAVARSKGTDVIAVAGVIRKNDLGMLVDRKLGAADPRELARKKATIYFESTSFQSLFPPFFKNLGIDPSQLNLVPMSPATAIGTYLAGQGDALITTVPYVLPVVDAKRPSDTLMFADYRLPLPAHGLVVSRNVLNRKADPIRRFLAVTGRAWDQVWNGDGQEAIDALVRERPNAKLDAALELKRIAAYKPYATTKAAEGKYVLFMPPEDWEAAIRVMRDAVIISPDSKATDFYTNSLLPQS
jgi:NitT/TauT family transport system substrate-binding protein